jgi:hypothetical protein
VLHSFLEVEDYDSCFRLNYYDSISSETDVLLTQYHTLIAQMGKASLSPRYEYEIVGNGVSKRACENPEYYYDFIDCTFCRPGCPLRYIGDCECYLRCLADECHNNLDDWERL